VRLHKKRMIFLFSSAISISFLNFLIYLGHWKTFTCPSFDHVMLENSWFGLELLSPVTGNVSGTLLFWLQCTVCWILYQDTFPLFQVWNWSLGTASWLQYSLVFYSFLHSTSLQNTVIQDGWSFSFLSWDWPMAISLSVFLQLHQEVTRLVTNTMMLQM